MIEIQLSTEPWSMVDVDAFVCPVNSECTYESYPASRIKDISGLPMEQLLMPHTPLAVGAAFVTPAGNMRARHIIHVPNTQKAGGPVLVEDIARATSAVIVAAELRNFHTLAVPLMGAFDGGIPAEEAARAIHSEFKAYRGERNMRVFLMARTPDEVEVFEMAMDGLG